MKAEDLIRDKFKDYIEDDVLMFEKWDVVIKDKVEEEGIPVIKETVIGETTHGIQVIKLAEMFRTILEDDVTYANNKLQAMIDNDEITVDEKIVSRGIAKYLQIIKDAGIDF